MARDAFLLVCPFVFHGRQLVGIQNTTSHEFGLWYESILSFTNFLLYFGL